MIILNKVYKCTKNNQMYYVETTLKEEDSDKVAVLYYPMDGSTPNFDDGRYMEIKKFCEKFELENEIL